MASRTSPRDARRLAAKTLQRITSVAEPDDAAIAKLRDLDLALDTAIADYNAAKINAGSSRGGRKAFHAAGRRLDSIAGEIRKLGAAA